MRSISIKVIFLFFQLYCKLVPYKKLLFGGALIISYLVITIGFLRQYFITDFTVWTAILLFPYIAKPNEEHLGNRRYGLLSAIFIVLTYFTGVQTFYFLSVGFAVLFVIESLTGSIGYLPFFLLGLISPTFKYFDNMLGFPVRLKLSEIVGNILQHLGYKIEVIGNAFMLNGTEFSVDPACVGLKMMAVSMLIGLLIMAYFQRLAGRKFSFLSIAGILVLITALNILSNLMRILILSIFCILPSNPAHDAVGLICFVLYVVLPSYLLIKLASKKFLAKKETSSNQNRTLKTPLNLLLLCAILFVGFVKMNNRVIPKSAAPTLTYCGYSKEIVNDDIVKLEKEGILLYVKPLQRFYGAEHNPMICWVGSGYEFSRISKQKFNSKEVFTGILKKGSDTIYAAWWFDSGNHQTIEQMDWRWRALKGEAFYLVNVNSNSEANLWKEIGELLKKER